MEPGCARPRAEHYLASVRVFRTQVGLFEFRTALPHNQRILRARAIVLVGGELEPFHRQRLKHRRDLIAGRAFRHLGNNLEAILIQPGGSDDLVTFHLEGFHEDDLEGVAAQCDRPRAQGVVDDALVRPLHRRHFELRLVRGVLGSDCADCGERDGQAGGRLSTVKRLGIAQLEPEWDNLGA
jgi:hypothetical protein